MKIEMSQRSMAEAKEIVENSETENKEVRDFLKKFVKLDKKETAEMRKELEDLEMIKMKNEQIAKIMDLLPESASDVNKIFVDVSLGEDEINKILEVVKKYTQ